MSRIKGIRFATLPDGRHFQVPAYIQRIDDARTHGWQLRYGKWTFFSDKSVKTDGAMGSLKQAITELRHRIESIDAPTGLRRHRNQNKVSLLPAGISGPIERRRPGRLVGELSYGVTVPRFGQRPTNRMVYIGTTNTVNESRLAQALAKALKIREDAVTCYQLEANTAKRDMLALLEQFDARPLGRQAASTHAECHLNAMEALAA